MDSVASLTTGTVNITDAYNDIKRQVDINLPEGVSLLNTRLTPEVNVRIKPFAKKTVNVRNTDISLVGGNENIYNYSITGGLFSYQFTGKEEDISNININSLKPQVDVNGLGTGTHVLQIKITVSGDVEVEGSYFATVVISEKPATQEPSMSPDPSATPKPK